MDYLPRILSVFAVLFILANCVQRMQSIYNAENIALPPVFETAAPSEIASTIERGAKDAGWRVKTIGPQELEATLKIRVHTAIVRILYSQSEYSITYKSSSNLPYTGTRIHKNYNLWIERLKTKINNSLQLKASKIRTAINRISDDPEKAWNAVKDSDSVTVMREFLRKHQDSSFAPYAIKRLNELGEGKQLARTNSNTALKDLSSSATSEFRVAGKWRVDANYTAAPGVANPCLTNLHWDFLVVFNDRPFSIVEWHKGEALYVTGEYTRNKAEMQINFPNGGNSWYWTESFILNEKVKLLKAEAKSTGGFYGNCIGSIEVRMEKLD